MQMIIYTNDNVKFYGTGVKLILLSAVVLENCTGVENNPDRMHSAVMR